jgi:hypothetical protein
MMICGMRVALHRAWHPVEPDEDALSECALPLLHS